MGRVLSRRRRSVGRLLGCRTSVSQAKVHMYCRTTHDNADPGVQGYGDRIPNAVGPELGCCTMHHADSLASGMTVHRVAGAQARHKKVRRAVNAESAETGDRSEEESCMQHSAVHLADMKSGALGRCKILIDQSSSSHSFGTFGGGQKTVILQRSGFRHDI